MRKTLLFTAIFSLSFFSENFCSDGWSMVVPPPNDDSDFIIINTPVHEGDYEEYLETIDEKKSIGLKRIIIDNKKEIFTCSVIGIGIVAIVGIVIIYKIVEFILKNKKRIKRFLRRWRGTKKRRLKNAAPV